MYKNFLFDLDGTLLPMNMKKFVELYVASICKRFAPEIGINPKLFANGIWRGAGAMAKNDGDCLNIEVFWRTMNDICGKDMRVYSDAFDDYYRNEFVVARSATGVNPYARKSVELIKQNGGKLIVATNPIFPKAATYRRIEWAGLNVNDFEYITTYDNSSSCKPNLNYFYDICSVCGITPEESLMVGNDVDEDMCASRLGFNVYLIRDCMINRHGKNIDFYKNGSFKDFYSWLKMSFLQSKY